MIVVKKYTAIQVCSKTVDFTVVPKFTYGEITGPHYNQTHPQEEFDTEDEAIVYAEKIDKWATWMIVPIVRFKD